MTQLKPEDIKEIIVRNIDNAKYHEQASLIVFLNFSILIFTIIDIGFRNIKYGTNRADVYAPFVLALFIITAIFLLYLFDNIKAYYIALFQSFGLTEIYRVGMPNDIINARVRKSVMAIHFRLLTYSPLFVLIVAIIILMMDIYPTIPPSSEISIILLGFFALIPITLYFAKKPC